MADDNDDDSGGGGIGLDNPRLELVRFFFAVDGAAEYDVRRVRWTEGIAQPFELVLDLRTNEVDTNTDELLGANAEFTVERGDRVGRTCYGIIHRVDYVGMLRDRLAIRVYIAPAFRLLSQRIDTRIFQGKTTPEIVEELLGEHFADFEREVDVSARVKGSYNKRDYCLQFRESVFDFCSRIMQEDGIAYVFEFDDDSRREKLVLIDNNDDYAEVELIVDDLVPIIASSPEEADRESLRYFDVVKPRTTNKVVAWGFNFKNPTGIDEAESEKADPHNARVRELYLFDDRRQIVDDPNDDPNAESFNGTALEQRGPLARNRMEHIHTTRVVGRSASNLTGIAPGLYFTVEDHEREEVVTGRWLVTRIVHKGEAPGVDLDQDASEARLEFVNTFECIPEAHVFRPAEVTPKPRVYGAQTATVVGPAGEEIHTDPHGRIKVKFHWDRLNPADETASCWVRVAQTWAGPNWGAMVIPRIGMEVLIDFLDGNPDRPLAVGCVYNQDNPPPYALPDEKTKSTFKTNSSPGGGGSNELRFEDAAGSEEVYIHAQKDFNEVVENNHTTTVHGNQTNTVDGSQTQTIGGDQTEHVKGEQKMTVDKNRTVTIGGSEAITIKGAEGNSGVDGASLNVTGDYKVDASNHVQIQAPTHIKLTCGGSEILIEPGKISITAGGAAKVILDANALMQSSAGTKVLLDGNALAQASGGAKVLLDGNALVQASGGGKLKLDGNADMTSSGGSQVKLDSGALVSGSSKATVTAPTSTLAGGGGSVEAAGAGVTAAGGKVDISGGMVGISGGMVKIN